MTLIGRILIEQLEVHAYHGWHAHEKEFGQPFTVDLELEADMLEIGLPHARDEFTKLVGELKKLGFREDARTSLGEAEATINVGRTQDS